MRVLIVVLVVVGCGIGDVVFVIFVFWVVEFVSVCVDWIGFVGIYVGCLVVFIVWFCVGWSTVKVVYVEGVVCVFFCICTVIIDSFVGEVVLGRIIVGIGVVDVCIVFCEVGCNCFIVYEGIIFVFWCIGG